MAGPGSWIPRQADLLSSGTFPRVMWSQACPHAAVELLEDLLADFFGECLCVELWSEATEQP